VSLLENVEGSIELNQNTVCVYGLSRGCNVGTTVNLTSKGQNNTHLKLLYYSKTGITEYINLENSGSDGEMIKKAIFDSIQHSCMLSILLQLPPLLPRKFLFKFSSFAANPWDFLIIDRSFFQYFHSEYVVEYVVHIVI
jgi:hypothetical protein